MIANLMGGDGLIFLVIALVVLVGGSQLPKLARNVGLAGREFRKAQMEAEEEEAQRRAAKAAADAVAAPASLAAPEAPAVPGVAPAAPEAPTAAAAPVGPVAHAPQGAPEEPSITLTASQLEALLKARQQQAGGGVGR